MPSTSGGAVWRMTVPESLSVVKRALRPLPVGESLRQIHRVFTTEPSWTRAAPGVGVGAAAQHEEEAPMQDWRDEPVPYVASTMPRRR